MSFELAQKKFLTYLFGALAALSAFPYLFLFTGELAPLRFITLLFVALCLACIALNRMGFYLLARHGLFTGANLYLFITASWFGRETGEQFLYLPVIFAAGLLYDLSEVKSLVFSIGLSVICIVTLEATDYALFSANLSAAEQLTYYYGNLAITFVLTVAIAVYYFKVASTSAATARQNVRHEQVIAAAQESEKIINYFATSLYGKNTVDEILWDLAKNCISHLGFEDCVVYMVNEKNGVLEQKAAYGPKNPREFEISNLITIPMGKGIVGAVATSGVAEIINDTAADPRYIVDDEARAAEIAVPIVYQDKVIGVIDSEHTQKHFFNDTHLKLLTTIASLASNKIVKAIAEEEKLNATLERLEAEKIREVDKLKSQFFAHISHEFRTPLTLILGPLDQLLRTPRPPEEISQLQLMQENGRKLLELINDLLELSKMNEGLLSLDLRRQDIIPLIHTTVSSFHSLAAQKKIAITTQVQQGSHVLTYDSSRIETILINLLSNAIKISPPAGSISVHVQQVAGYLEIVVFNSGRQLAPGQLEKLFERSDGDRDVAEGKRDGHGIGLALSRELAIMHGGSLRLRTDARGNAFILSIPVIETAPQIRMTPDTTAPPPGEAVNVEVENLNRLPVVLIVEDSDQLRMFLRRILVEDFHLVEACNGKEGLKSCFEHVPDLVISDIMMPEMDGLEFCKQLRAAEVTSHIPILLLTALSDLESRLEGLETGADYYLPKPFEPRELLTIAHNLISQRRKLRDQFSKKILLKTHEWQGLNADERFLQKLVGLVEDHLANPEFNIESIQKELGISRMQLHRKLKALTGQSATEFIRTIRLKIAAEILQKGHENVSQVAYQVGFNSLSYFTKCFKEQFGVIPSAYGEKKPSSTLE